MFGRLAGTFAKSFSQKAAVMAVTAVSAAGVAFATQRKLASAEASAHGGLNPKDFVPLKVAAVETYNYNTKIISLALESPSAQANLPITSYVVTRADGLTADGKPTMRPYTPIHSNKNGVVTLLVKEYPTGTMSKHLCNLKVGDSVDVKGPLPKYKYTPNEVKKVTLIAGGTGITPVLQLAEAILANKEDKTKVEFVFANTSQKDILLKSELDALAAKHKDQVKMTYVIDKPEAGFTGHTGYLTKDLLSKLVDKPSADNKVFVCGPPGFMTAVSGAKAPDYSQGEVDGALKELGFTKDNVFKF
mgnify:CR=1 FL=1